MDSEAQYFATAREFRAWLREHHRREAEVRVGFHKAHTGKAGLTWAESVAEALCFGWIDGVRKRVDAERYVIRFSPRKRGSTWSAVNIRMVEELEASGRMMAAGREAFRARRESRSKVYSYEQEGARLGAGREREFRKAKAAWAYFAAQAPWYRKKAAWWVESAKQEKTREARFRKLVEASGRGKLV